VAADAPRSAAPAEPGRVAVLDGLRGIAILLVFVFHTGLGVGAVPDPGFERVYADVVRAGWFGVDLFFVLSGYLITGILLDARGHPRYFVNFYARRSLRIFPLYYGVLTVFLVAPLLGKDLGFTHAGWFWLYAQNWLIAAEGWPSVAAHFWSLAVEEQFYVVWPAVVRWAPHRHLLWFLAAPIPLAIAARALLVAAEDGMASDGAYVLMPCRMDALALGGVLAVLLRSDLWRRRLRRAAPFVLLLGIGIAATLFVARGGLRIMDPVVQVYGYSVFALSFGALLVLVATTREGSWLERVLGWKPLCWIGVVSYGIYVFHWILIVRFRHLFTPIYDHLGWPLIHAVVTLAFAAVVGALAAASWYLYERPILRLRSRFARPAA
jgi:peptidoglycan/LPS O-acetylase OafA/YrhL